MGVFDDKKFDELDWISQATEPIDSKMNEILGLLPESLSIDFDLYRQISNSSYNLDLNINKVITYLCKTYCRNIVLELSYQQMQAIEKCFKMEISSNELVLNFEDKTITGGEISVIKIQTTMDELVLKGMLGQEGMEQLSYCNMNDFSSNSRMNEVMELLTKCEEGLKTRSQYKKRNVIIKRMARLFKDNEWNIRDTELANKLGIWIRDYVQDGNLAAFSNFCRLKVMTHKGQPIYSMEEIV